MTRALVALVIGAGLLAVAHPLEQILRGSAPPRPAHTEIGAGRIVGGVLTGPFRPLLQTYLFLRAERLAAQGRYDELHQHYRTLVMLYPENEEARAYLGWHLAFNLKREASDDELAWRWAREGLDVLMGLDSGKRTVAYWCLAQCGQNALHPVAPLRYAGADWDAERRWRARLRTWARERFGKDLTRFETALAVLGDDERFYERSTRVAALELLAYEDLITRGQARDLEGTLNSMRRFAQSVTDNLALAQVLVENIGLLDAVANARVGDMGKYGGVEPYPRAYRAALGLAGVAVARKHAANLRTAAGAIATLDRMIDENEMIYDEERSALLPWVKYLDSGAQGPPPARPFSAE